MPKRVVAEDVVCLTEATAATSDVVFVNKSLSALCFRFDFIFLKTLVSFFGPSLGEFRNRECFFQLRMSGAGAGAPECAKDAVLVKSQKLPEQTPEVIGYDWERGLNYQKLFESYLTSGYQATNLGLAVQEIDKMLSSRKVPLPADLIDDMEEDPFIKRKYNCTIFLGYTSNLVSSGLRETIKYLVKHKHVDCIVTTAGGVEEDLIKCLAPTFLGDFELDGRTLRERGINRIGNLLVPNDNYCKFEDWLMPILDRMVDEQRDNGKVWSPSRLIERLGKEINNTDSICYWAAINQVKIRNKNIYFL